jgi:two-component sensor histidine kinase
MALIHQFLYKDVGNLTSLHIKDYIQELLAHIEDTNRKAGTMITLEQQADDVELDIDVVVPLGLIINELVTNAYKYAFEGKTEGHIRVSFTRQPDTNGYLLRVTDDGNGMIENPLLKKQIPLVTE